MQSTLANSYLYISLVRCVHCGSFRDVEANVLDCVLEVSEFEPQSRYYVHIQTNTLGKGMNLLIHPQIWIK